MQQPLLLQPAEATYYWDASIRAEGAFDRLHPRVKFCLWHLRWRSEFQMDAAASGRSPNATGLPDGYELFNIKTALAPRDCAREALGQLLGHAYWPGSPDFNAVDRRSVAARQRDARISRWSTRAFRNTGELPASTRCDTIVLTREARAIPVTPLLATPA